MLPVQVSDAAKPFFGHCQIPLCIRHAYSCLNYSHQVPRMTGTGNKNDTWDGFLHWGQKCSLVPVPGTAFPEGAFHVPSDYGLNRTSFSGHGCPSNCALSATPLQVRAGVIFRYRCPTWQNIFGHCQTPLSILHAYGCPNHPRFSGHGCLSNRWP